MKTIYIVREYDIQTKEYTELGTVTSTSRKEARKAFIEQNNWKPKKNTTLFMKNSSYEVG